MKRALFGTLSALLLTAAAAPSAMAAESITPNNLVNRAYNGAYTDQGIPSFNNLANAQRYGRVKAEDLVKGAIADGRLSQDTLSDEGYLNAVENALEDLGRDGTSD